MFLAYIDDTGDDGFPKYASPLFVLSTIYLPASDWKTQFNRIRDYRHLLKNKYDIPAKWEFHTKYFLAGKRPYTNLNISDESKIDIMNGFCDLIGGMNARIVNVVINKKAIYIPKYEVHDRALTYLVQRIENDLVKQFKSDNFLLVVDEGRKDVFRKTIRQIQAFNYIPSFQQPGTAYRKEISLLVEDPIVKESKESFFIQLCDLVGFVVYHYMVMKLGVGGEPNRMQRFLSRELLVNWLERMKPCLNLEADRNRKHGYGIVCYPGP